MPKLLTEFKYVSYFIVVARNFEINEVICQRVRYFQVMLGRVYMFWYRVLVSCTFHNFQLFVQCICLYIHLYGKIYNSC